MLWVSTGTREWVKELCCSACWTEVFGFQKGTPAVLSKGCSCFRLPPAVRNTFSCLLWWWRGSENVPCMIWTGSLPSTLLRATCVGLSSSRAVLCKAAGEEAGNEAVRSCGEIDIYYVPLSCSLKHPSSWPPPNSDLYKLWASPRPVKYEDHGIRQTWECTLPGCGTWTGYWTSLSLSYLFVKFGFQYLLHRVIVSQVIVWPDALPRVSHLACLGEHQSPPHLFHSSLCYLMEADEFSKTDQKPSQWT